MSPRRSLIQLICRSGWTLAAALGGMPGLPCFAAEIAPAETGEADFQVLVSGVEQATARCLDGIAVAAAWNEKSKRFQQVRLSPITQAGSPIAMISTDANECFREPSNDNPAPQLCAGTGALPGSHHSAALVVAPSSTQEAKVLANFIAQKFKRIVMFVADDQISTSFGGEFRRYLQAFGGLVVIEENSAVLRREDKQLNEAIRNSRADALVVSDLGANLPRTLADVRRELPSLPVFTTSAVSELEKGAVGAAALEGVRFTAPSMHQAAFLKRFRRQFPKTSPTRISYSCYTGWFALYQAFAKAEPGALAAAELDSARQALSSSLQQLKRVQVLDEQLPIEGKAVQFELGLHVFRNGSIWPVDSKH